MKRTQTLRKQQTALRQQIGECLDILIGTVNKSPSMSGHNLTTKVKGKTVTVYVRKDIVETAKEMTARNRKLRVLLNQLSEVNWQLLKRDAL